MLVVTLIELASAAQETDLHGSEDVRCRKDAAIDDMLRLGVRLTTRLGE